MLYSMEPKNRLGQMDVEFLLKFLLTFLAGAVFIASLLFIMRKFA